MSAVELPRGSRAYGQRRVSKHPDRMDKLNGKMYAGQEPFIVPEPIGNGSYVIRSPRNAQTSGNMYQHSGDSSYMPKSSEHRSVNGIKPDAPARYGNEFSSSQDVPARPRRANGYSNGNHTGDRHHRSSTNLEYGDVRNGHHLTNTVENGGAFVKKANGTLPKRRDKPTSYADPPRKFAGSEKMTSKHQNGESGGRGYGSLEVKSMGYEILPNARPSNWKDSTQRDFSVPANNGGSLKPREYSQEPDSTLSREDSFFAKVMAYEKSKRKENGVASNQATSKDVNKPSSYEVVESAAVERPSSKLSKPPAQAHLNGKARNGSTEDNLSSNLDYTGIVPSSPYVEIDSSTLRGLPYQSHVKKSVPVETSPRGQTRLSNSASNTTINGSSPGKYIEPENPTWLNEKPQQQQQLQQNPPNGEAKTPRGIGNHSPTKKWLTSNSSTLSNIQKPTSPRKFSPQQVSPNRTETDSSTSPSLYDEVKRNLHHVNGTRSTSPSVPTNEVAPKVVIPSIRQKTATPTMQTPTAHSQSPLKSGQKPNGFVTPQNNEHSHSPIVTATKKVNGVSSSYNNGSTHFPVYEAKLKPTVTNSNCSNHSQANSDSSSSLTATHNHSPVMPTIVPKVAEKKSPSSADRKSVSPPRLLSKVSPSFDIGSSISRFDHPYSNKKVIIMDMGHYFVRVGVLRDQHIKPDLCLPHTIGVTSNGLLFGDAVNQVADGNVAKSLGPTTVVSPLLQSQIVKPVMVKGLPIQRAFFQNIIQRLKLTDKGYKLLLCLPSRASALRPHFIDYFLNPSSAADDDLSRIDAVATVSSFRAALQTSKVPTCLIIAFNADLEIIPIAEGTLIEHGRSLTALYGEAALQAFMNDLTNYGVNITEKEVECYGHFIYQKAAFIENKEVTCHDVVVDLSEYKPYPIDKRITVPAEVRVRAGDGLLRPEAASGHDGQAPEFRHLLRRALRACDLDFRSAVAANVVLIGEFANIQGLRERVSEEVRACLTTPKGGTSLAASAANVQVQVAPGAPCTAYDGACVLASLLTGPNPPPCPWLRFLSSSDWASMRHDTRTTPDGEIDTRLLSRLNRDCAWP